MAYSETREAKGRTQIRNPNKSAGPDGLHPRILRELAGPFVIPVCSRLNRCFEQAKIPEDWKDSNVTGILILKRR